ncbi:SRPBCC family protein [Nocardioides hankookensis]|uniref:SRPBCC family protein n=1 Tax=Nocardioides hankookensis TaxID=443157 RepID=A0ABW1LLB1_9ACTN
MTTTASHVSVAVPVDVVWDLLAGFADISRWASNVSQSSLLTAGPPGPGTVRRVQVGRAALRETITVWEPGRELAYDIAGLPAIVTAASNTWTLAPDGTGTAVTLTGTVATRGGPLLDRLVARQVGKAGDQLTQSLGTYLRSQP